jgi:hypothetical protein
VGREDLIAVASRILAVFLLVTIARSLPSAMALLDQGEPRPSLLLVGLVLAFGMSICAFLWVFPLTVARALLPVMREPRSETAMSGSVALSVGLTLLGVWVMAYAIPDLLYWATLFLLTRQHGAAYFGWGYEQISSVITTVAELVLAAWLIFGSSGIKRLILRYRHGSLADVA